MTIFRVEVRKSEGKWHERENLATAEGRFQKIMKWITFITQGILRLFLSDLASAYLRPSPSGRFLNLCLLFHSFSLITQSFIHRLAYPSPRVILLLKRGRWDYLWMKKNVFVNGFQKPENCPLAKKIINHAVGKYHLFASI